MSGFHGRLFHPFPSEAAFEQVRQLIFRVETRWNSPDGEVVAQATAFGTARLSKSNRLVVATAAHVLDFPPDRQVHWRVQEVSPHGRTERQVSFETDGRQGDAVPYHYHKKLDIGVCILPEIADNGERFARPSELGIPPVEMRRGATTGTRVGWAGFPTQVEEFLGFPQLCYFEGVVSCTVDSDGKCLYIVDGHSAKGVSGGPVWHWSSDRNQIEVVGIVSGYGQQSVEMHGGLFVPPLPGFCVFEPFNPVIHYIESWNRET